MAFNMSDRWRHTKLALWTSLWPHRKLLALSVVLSVLEGTVAVAGISAFLPIIAIMAGQGMSGVASVPILGPLMSRLSPDLNTVLVVLIGGLFILGLLKAVLGFASGIIQSRARNAVDSEWQKRVLFRWLEASFTNHGSESSSRVMHLCSNEVNQLGSATGSLVSILAGLIRAGIALLFLALVSWRALFGVAAAMVLILIPLYFLIPRLFPMAGRDMELVMRYSTQLHDVIRRVTLIDIFDMAKTERAILDKYLRMYLASRIRLDAYRLIGPAVVQVAAIGILCLLVAYFFASAAGPDLLNQGILFIGGLAIVQPQLQAISMNFGDLARITASIEAMEPVLRLPPYQPRLTLKDGTVPDLKHYDIEAERLCFSYGADETSARSILKDVNLHIPQGRLTLLFGSTGAGKTTLLRLLQRLIVPTAGQLRIGGYDLQEMPDHILSHSVLMMPQDEYVFTGTIRDNLTYSASDLTAATVDEAVRLAAVDQFLGRLQDGYDTFIGSNGALLSGGQKQRIALARIIVRRPKIYLLDEPTSALDRHVEERVLTSLLSLRDEGATIVMSTHKVELAPLADTLLWFEDQTIRQGTFDTFKEHLSAIKPTLYQVGSL